MLSGRAEAALRCVRNVRAGGGRGGVCREPPSGGGSLQRASLKRGESAESIPQGGSLQRASLRRGESAENLPQEGGVCREHQSGGGSQQRTSPKRGESAEILPQEGEADSLPKAKFRSHCSGGSLFLVSVLYSLVLVVHCLFVEKLYEPGYN